MKGYTNLLCLFDSRLAIKSIEEFKPDIILLDLMMPYVSGFDILEELTHRNLLDGNLPVLVLTADATQEAKLKAFNSGVSDFLTKPFDLIEAELRIRNLLVSKLRLKQLLEYNNKLENTVRERTEELVESNNNILKQNEKLRQIAWSQSHEVRAPLARIIGLIDIHNNISEITDHQERVKILNLIIDSCKELDDIIHKITYRVYDV